MDNNDMNTNNQEPPMDNLSDNEGSPNSDIEQIYNQLSPDEQKATKSYAQSFLDKHDDNNVNEPMFERYIIKNKKMIKA